MLNSGILNPHAPSLLARVRHTNTLVVADKGLPFWPQIETMDLSFTDDVPTVLQVLTGIRWFFTIGHVCMAEESLAANPEQTQAEFRRAFAEVALNFEPHEGNGALFQRDLDIGLRNRVAMAFRLQSFVYEA